MKDRSSAFHSFACFLFIAATGMSTEPCGQPPKTALAAEVLMTGQQCLPPSDGWRASWISSSDELSRMISRCSAGSMAAASEEPPDVDFERFGVLAVEMGRKSSAGYGFIADNITAGLEGKTAIVKLPWRKPDPGAVTAQMISSPWILIRLPAGGYSEIQVIDNDNLVLARINLF